MLQKNNVATLKLWGNNTALGQCLGGWSQWWRTSALDVENKNRWSKQKSDKPNTKKKYRFIMVHHGFSWLAWQYPFMFHNLSTSIYCTLNVHCCKRKQNKKRIISKFSWYPSHSTAFCRCSNVTWAGKTPSEESFFWTNKRPKTSQKMIQNDTSTIRHGMAWFHAPSSGCSSYVDCPSAPWSNYLNTMNVLRFLLLSWNHFI